MLARPSGSQSLIGRVRTGDGYGGLASNVVGELEDVGCIVDNMCWLDCVSRCWSLVRTRKWLMDGKWFFFCWTNSWMHYRYEFRKCTMLELGIYMEDFIVCRWKKKIPLGHLKSWQWILAASRTQGSHSSKQQRRYIAYVYYYDLGTRYIQIFIHYYSHLESTKKIRTRDHEREEKKR